MNQNELVQPTAAERDRSYQAPRACPESRRLIASALLAVGLLTDRRRRRRECGEPRSVDAPTADAPAAAGAATQTQSGDCPNM